MAQRDDNSGRRRTDSRWTVSLREHLEALRAADDRRYSEVNVEREKALKIKQEADKLALDLAREIQTYKDEQANQLREQINSERNLYPTKSQLYGYMVGAAAVGAAITAIVRR